MVQVAEDTGDSGCEAHYSRVEEKKALEEYTVPWCPFPPDGAPGRQRHHYRANFVLVQEEVDVGTFQAVRQITHLLHIPK